MSNEQERKIGTPADEFVAEGKKAQAKRRVAEKLHELNEAITAAGEVGFKHQVTIKYDNGDHIGLDIDMTERL